MLSASFVIGVVFLWISRKRPVSNLWGIWCLLFLLIPLPFGFGDDLILGLQSLSSTISSQLLDLAASTM